MPAHKLVLGLPWYGTDNLCLGGGPTQTHCNATSKVSISYYGAEALLSGTSPLLANRTLTTSRLFNSTSSSPYFNYRDKRDGSIHQIWYEDASSLGLKYGMARKLGLRGVGFWVASGTWPEREVLATKVGLQAMWGSVRDNFIDPARVDGNQPDASHKDRLRLKTDELQAAIRSQGFSGVYHTALCDSSLKTDDAYEDGSLLSLHARTAAVGAAATARQTTDPGGPLADERFIRVRAGESIH